MGNPDSGFPPGSFLPDTEPPWGSSTPNPVDVESCDKEVELVKVKEKSEGGRTPEPGPVREPAT